MSERLPLPKRLAGDWEHALILTYGANLGFYESALWRDLARCRNKVVLADTRQLLRSWEEEAAGWRLRFVNRRYVVEGVQLPRAVHAKAILLASEEHGRLLVGSGNLGYQGYASGGEVFSEYTYASDTPEHLEAFGAVWSLVEAARTQGWIGPTASRHLLQLAEEVPWLSRAGALASSAAGTSGPVRHNLTQPLAEQFREAIGRRRVDMLWLAAPFLDHASEALRWLLTTLRPRKAALLIQEGCTSARPTALESVLKSFPALELVPYTAGSDNPYVHAKFYIAQMPDGAICLHGSPNLSASALLRTVPAGNLELANLVEGERGAFQELLAPLYRRQGVRVARDLELARPESDPEPTWLQSGWRLLGGEWQDDDLWLRSAGPMPIGLKTANLPAVSVRIGQEFVAVRLTDIEGGTLHLQLSLEAQAALEQEPAPVRLCWGDSWREVSNAIYIANRRSLDLELQTGDLQAATQAIRDTELNDQTLEDLLVELDQSLMWNPGSVWKVAGRTAAGPIEWDEDGVELSYADVDEAAVRSHPRVQQYLSAYQAGRIDQPTRLQLLLRSILGHFDDLKGAVNAGTWRTPAASPKPSQNPEASAIEGDAADAAADEAAEVADQQKEREDRRRAALIKRFLRKYLKGHESQAFRSLAGFEVVSQNAILFNHLLIRLFLKEWVDHPVVADAWLRLWTGLIGNASGTGWVSAASEENRVLWHEQLHLHHTVGECLAMTYFLDRFLNDPIFLAGSEPTNTDWEALEESASQMRDVWRGWLARHEFEVVAADWEDAWVIVGSAFDLDRPLPSFIADRCTRLIRRETRTDFEIQLAQTCGEPRHRFVFDRPTMKDGISDRLCVPRADILGTPEQAEAILREWMRAESLPRYRLAWMQGEYEGIVVVYDGHDGTGIWYDKTSRGEHHFRRLHPATRSWDEALRSWHEAANQVEAAWAVPQEVKAHPVQ